jgi:hypothetical protein
MVIDERTLFSILLGSLSILVVISHRLKKQRQYDSRPAHRWY